MKWNQRKLNDIKLNWIVLYWIELNRFKFTWFDLIWFELNWAGPIELYWQEQKYTIIKMSKKSVHIIIWRLKGLDVF